MKRKYLPITNYPVYNEAVTRLIMQSEILSGTERHIGANSVLWDLTNLKIVLLEKVGGPDGRYLDKYKESQIAELPLIQERIRDVQLDFEKLKIQKEMQGSPIPDTMPIEMQRDLYLLEAKLTICEGEIQAIEKKIKELESVKQDAEEKKVLQYGIKLSKVIKDNSIVEIDFQKVSKLDGQYFINEKISPYYGMPLEYYLKMPLSRGIRVKDMKSLPDYPSEFPKLKAKSHAEADNQ